ncbi:SDR family oxidoreductase [Nocardioides zeae]|uniref:SDR family oxidoreductase n=1 Tax=Nocardioides imazamoxiresistens TaxID=3231893 RepID=A0ABU3PS09_9ACTN|nr:SDR family oxidoreductase [Nocardioides zeae]MDT9591681.1 SDR family oxidoreductase [Nocardioides zeae]
MTIVDQDAASVTTAPTTRSGVVVTGAARGLGRGIAEVLAAHGWNVVGVDLAPEMDQVAADLGPGHGSVVGDAGDGEVLERACRLAAELGDGVGAAVFNAGVTAPGASVGYDLDDWDRVLGVNLRGVFIGAQAVRPHLVAGGAMVMLSSICSTQGFAARASYCASKAGVDGLVRSLAQEWGPDGIRVNAIAPGTIETEMQQAMVASGRASMSGYLERVPLGRIGRPSEIGEAAAFLVSPRSSYVSGVVLPVDGGWAGGGLPATAPS